MRMPLVSLVATLVACGQKSGSSELGNSPPSVPEIELGPGEPTSSDHLVVDIVTPALDPDGDRVEYVVSWAVDGEVQPSLNSLTLDRGFTYKGDTWSVEVAATDGQLQSESVSAEVVIQNSLPTVSNIVVTPENPTVKDELRCQFDDPVDLDNDEVGVMQTWAVNGETLGVEGPLSAPWFVKHNVVECLVYAEDGSDVSEPSRSEPIEIQNSLPNVIGCSLADNNPPDDVPLTAVSEGFYDDDGDAEGYRYVWYIFRDGIEEAVSEESALLPGLMAPGDRVHVECTAWDGESEGNTVTSGYGTVIDG